MKFERFEEIIAWQKAKVLTLEIYIILNKIKDFGFINQITRASISIMNNIAEGYERKSNNEFKQFLYISKGSCGEVRSMLHLGKDLEYFSKEQFNKLSGLSLEIAKILSGLIKVL
jgi:four helix bundle protein